MQRLRCSRIITEAVELGRHTQFSIIRTVVSCSDEWVSQSPGSSRAKWHDAVMQLSMSDRLELSARTTMTNSTAHVPY